MFESSFLVKDRDLVNEVSQSGLTHELGLDVFAVGLFWFLLMEDLTVKVALWVGL